MENWSIYKSKLKALENFDMNLDSTLLIKIHPEPTIYFAWDWLIMIIFNTEEK